MGSGSPAAHPGRSLSPGKPLPLLPAEVRGPRALGRLCSPALKSPRGVRRSSPAGSPLGSAAPQPEGDGGGVGGGVGGGLGLLYFPRHPALRRVTGTWQVLAKQSVNHPAETRTLPRDASSLSPAGNPPSALAGGSRHRVPDLPQTHPPFFFFFKSSTFCRVPPPRCRPPRPRRAAVATPRPRGPLGSQSPAGETVAESLVRGAPHRGIPMLTHVGPGTGDASPPRVPGPAGNETETSFPPPRNRHRSPERNAGT